MEEELRRSEERYRSVYSMTPLAFVLWAPDRTVLDWNRRAEEMFGWSKEEVLGKDFFEFLIPDAEKVSVAGLVRAILERSSPTFSVNRNATKDGRVLWCEWYTSLLSDAGGRVEALLSLGLDVTDRRLAEEKIASLAKFPSENPYPVMRLLRNGVLQYANEASRSLLSEWGCDVGDTAPPFLLAQAAEAVSGGAPTLADVPCGSRTYSFALTPITDLGYVNLYGQDVTDRKRVEQALRESEEKYRSLYGAVSGGVVMQDTDGRIVEANAEAGEILGLTADHMWGLTSADPRWRTIREDGSAFPVEERPLAIALRTGKQVRNCLSGVFNPTLEEYRWVLTNAEPLLERDTGEVRGAVATFWDITERKKAEERLQAALEEKEILLRELHHRVKNNLQVISTLLGLRAAGISDPAALRAFRDSQSRVRAMALIHERLYQSESLAQIDFHAYITDLMEHLFRAFGTEPEAVQLSLDIEHAPVGVDTAIPVGLILNELVSNALKYAFPGGRRGQVRIRLRRPADPILELVVGDDGVGLPPGVDFKNTESLGLQLVCILVRQLGGEIEQLPQPGAAFRMTFKETSGRRRIAS